jgi:aminopeptidase-like protein
MMMSPVMRLETCEATGVGRQMHDFASVLYPICRSITGDGIRETLGRIGERIPLRRIDVPSGTPVFDWTIPQEWNIRDGYIADASGTRVVDFQKCNLHVMSYSRPIHTVMPFAELREHLFTIPEHPDWIPYRTSYYQQAWAFCLSHKQMLEMDETAEYEVCIDSTLTDGFLSYGEYFLPGKEPDEVLLSCHVCHPSLANDNLSGATVATFLAEALAQKSRRYSYRILFIPGTIGAITWLARNEESVARIRHGLVLTCLGDRGRFHYKRSRRGDAVIDRAASVVLRDNSKSNELLEFSPYGYDERQYCSPGFNLPVGCLMRSVWGTFPEYHTSADDLDFIHPESLAESLDTCLSIIDVLEHDRIYRNVKPYCEPQLGRRGLYGEAWEKTHARLWVLNLSDGRHSLLDIAERSGIAFPLIQDSARVLQEKGLLEPETKSPATAHLPLGRHD